MKLFVIVSILFFSSLTILHAEREVIPLGSDWKFIRQDVGVMAPADGWETITVPHSWNAIDGQAGNTPILHEIQSHEDAIATAKERQSKQIKTDDPSLKSGYYRGACWYLHNLEIPADWKGKKRVFIRFEAASLVAKVYLNKSLLGEHRGAFTAFCYELTPYINYGKSNELRVEVDNTHREDLQPISGDFNVNGGIYRPVQLLITDEVCITPLDFGSSGVYLTTKSLSDKQALLEVTSLISNGNRPEKASSLVSPAKLTIETEVKDANGKSVARASVEQEVSAEETKTVSQTLTLADPHRWQGRKDPYLYSATVRVFHDGQSVDEVTQQFGLRTVEITQEKGFLLNGQPYPIYGVNRHQDLRDKGWAMSLSDEEADMKLIADLGATAIRDAHYPQSESWHHLADRQGMLIWDEATVVNETRSTRAFWENTDEQMQEMIHQLYNHPSIAWWGTFNELDNNPTPPSASGLEGLRDLAHAFDPSRIIVGASDHGNRYYNLIPQQIAFNNYPGWYGKGQPEDMLGYIDKRYREVGKRIALSEYGGGGNPLQHIEGKPVRIDWKGPFHPEEWQGCIHEVEWAAMLNNPKLWGCFAWVMFDFPSASRNEGGTHALNDKGLVTQDRKIKKDAYFFYRANWNSEPTLYIASRRSILRILPTTEIKVYSNAENVELRVNGQSLGSVKPDAIKIARWPSVTLKPGENEIEAIAHFKGGEVRDSCQWTLDPASVW